MISIFAGAAIAKNDNNFGQQKSKNTNGQRLVDIDDDWAAEDIEEASIKGFLKGYEDGKFWPNKPVTCLETIVILVRAAGLQDEVDDYDLSDEELMILKKIPDWGKAYVAVALNEGILSEDEMKTFNPNQGAKRYQVCIYMQNVLDEFNIDPDDEEFMEDFIDGELVPLQARKSVRNMVRFGVVNGYPDGSFGPMRVVKRNEIARMVNYLDNICIQNSESYILKGILDEVDYEDDILTLNMTDNENEEWEFDIDEEDDVDIYYDGNKLDFDEDLEDIEVGGAIRILLNENEDPVWVKISAPVEEEDYVLLRGILDAVDFDGDVLSLDVIDSEEEEWEFDIDEEDDVDIYYDGQKLDFDEDLEDIEARGTIRILLNENEDPVWIKIYSPE